jgi:hypothetical protein
VDSSFEKQHYPDCGRDHAMVTGNPMRSKREETRTGNGGEFENRQGTT